MKRIDPNQCTVNGSGEGAFLERRMRERCASMQPKSEIVMLSVS
jgi:hypothetical protein